MVYLITNESTLAIVHRPTSFPGAVEWMFIHERTKKNGAHSFPKKKWLNFFTKTAQNKCKNTQNISFGGCYLLFEK